MILQLCKRFFTFQKNLKLLENRKPFEVKRYYCDKSKKPPEYKTLKEYVEEICAKKKLELLAIGSVALCYAYYRNYYVEISWREFISKYQNHEIDSLRVYNNWSRIIMKQKDSKAYWVNTPLYYDLIAVIADLDENSPESSNVPIINKTEQLGQLHRIGFIILTAIIILFYFMMDRSKGDVASKWKTKVTTKFADVAGCEEAKLEIIEFVNFLRNPDKYRHIGAKIPRGAILKGPPGTGKTLLAKAIAGEANVPFLSMSGSDFNKMFVGAGSKLVREIFSEARKCAPCIIFIDEIDAAASKRIAEDSPVSTALVQLLAEMDGMKPRDNIVVLAATNRIEALDPAILRPGRLDRHIYIKLPDIKGRCSIFKIYLENIKTDPSIDKTELARYLASRTTSFSGADISNLCNEAAIIATRNNSESVTMTHFSAALDRVVAGLESKNRVMSKRDRNIVAHHEAGHAVAGWFLENADPLMKVSLVPRGQALGFAMNLPIERGVAQTGVFLDQMCVLLGGRVAESIFFNSFSSGALDDLQKVTNSAYSQIIQYGFSSKVGHLNLVSDNRKQNFSESTSHIIDTEAKRIVDEAYARTMKLLTEKKDLLEKLALLLLEKECLEREDIESVLGKRPFKERLNYREFFEDSGALDDDESLPVGLKDWKKES